MSARRKPPNATVDRRGAQSPEPRLTRSSNAPEVLHPKVGVTDAHGHDELTNTDGSNKLASSGEQRPNYPAWGATSCRAGGPWLPPGIAAQTLEFLNAEWPNWRIFRT